MPDDLIIRAILDSSGVTAGAAQATAATKQLEDQLDHISVAGTKASVLQQKAFTDVAESAERSAARVRLAAQSVLRPGGVGGALPPPSTPPSPPVGIDLNRESLARLAAIRLGLQETQTVAERVAHGINAGLEEAFLTPSSFRTLSREIQALMPATVQFSDVVTRARTTAPLYEASTLGTAGLAGVGGAISQTRSGEGEMAAVAIAVQAAAAKKAVTQSLLQDSITYTSNEAKYRFEREEGIREEQRLGQEAADLKRNVQAKLANDAASAAAAEVKALVEVERARRISQVAQRGISPGEKIGLTEDQLNTLGLQHFMSASANARAEIVRLAASARLVGDASKQAGSAIASGFVAGSEAARSSMVILGAELKHGTGILDEYARNAKGAMVSSTVAALRDSGLLAKAIASITPEAAAAAGGIAILAAGLVAAIRDIWDTSQAVTSIINNLTILGQASQYSAGQIQGWQNDLRKNFGESVNSSRDLLEALNKLPPAASHLKPELSKLAEAFSALNEVSSKKGGEEVEKIFKGGGASALKYAEEIRAVSPAVAEHIKILLQAGHEEEALDQITAALSQQFGVAGQEISKSEAALYRMLGTTKDSYHPIAFLASGLIALGKAAGGFRADASEALAPLSDVQRIGQQTTIQALPEENKRELIRQRIQNEQAYQADLERELANIRAGGNELITRDPQALVGGGASVGFDTSKVVPGPETEERIRVLVESLGKAKEGAKELQLELAKIHTPEETEQLGVDRQIIAQRRLVAQRQNDQATLVALAKEEADLEVQYAHNTEVARTTAATRVQAAVEAQQQDEIAAELAKYRMTAAAAHRGSDERVNDIRHELSVLQQYHEEHTEKYRGLQVALATAQRQSLDQQFQDFKQEKLDEISETEHTVAAIRAAYESIKEEARRTNQLPVVITKLDRQENTAVAKQEHATFELARGGVQNQEQISKQLIAIDKAQNDIAVAQHRESKSAALVAEQQYTEQVLAQIIERVKAEELGTAASKDDTIKALQDLAKAEGEYAAKVIEDQAKITAAVEAENKKQVEAIKQGFDQVGSAVEGVFKGLIDGQLTATTKIVQQYHIAKNGVVFFSNEVQNRSLLANAALKILDATGSALTNTFLKLGEQAAAKALAPALGQQFAEGETPSLSGLLAKVVGGFIGLGTKKPPEEGLSKAGDKLTDAADHLKQAAELLAQKGVTGTGAGATAHGGNLAGSMSPSETAAEYAVGGAPIPGSGDTQSQMYQWLIGHGYSPTAASAVIGNAAAESGLRTDVVGNAGELGLFQELGPRRKGLEDYAASTGRSPTDLQVQLEWMDQELIKINPAFKSAGDSAANLAKQFEKEFERPASLADAPRRAGYAEQVYAAQSGASTAPQVATGPGQFLIPGTDAPIKTGTASGPGTDTSIKAAGTASGPDYTGVNVVGPLPGPNDHLPVMSPDYIFGSKIPRPKTDEYGHIHVAPLAPLKDKTDVASAPGAGISPTGTAGIPAMAGTPGGPAPNAPVPVDVEQVSGGNLPAVAGDGLPVTGTSPTGTAGIAGLPGSPSGPSVPTAPQVTQASIDANTNALATVSTAVTSQQSATQVDASDVQTNTTATKDSTTALVDNTAALKALTEKLGQAQPGTVSAATSAGGAYAAIPPGAGARLPSPVPSTGGSAAGEAASGVLQAGSAIGSAIGGPIGQVTSGVTKLVGAFNTVTSGVTKASDGIERMATGASSASSSVSTLSTATQVAGSAQTTLAATTQTAQVAKVAETTATQVGTTATIADQAATQTMAADALTAGAEFQAAGAEAAAGGAAGAAGSAVGTAGSVAKGILGLGGFLGFLSGGSKEIPQDGLAALHKGEMVVPAAEAAILRTGLPSAAGGMVVSPLGMTAFGTVGSPSTPGYVSPATPPPVTFPNIISPSGSSLTSLLALGGAGLLAGIPLISKLFGSKDWTGPGDWSSSNDTTPATDWSSIGTTPDASIGEGSWSSADGFLYGGVVPSAAGGMRVDDGKGGTLAIVHPNEMVLPADLSRGMQSIIAKGGVGGPGIPSADEGMVVPGDPISAQPTIGSGSSSKDFQQGTSSLQTSASTLGTAGTSLLSASQQLVVATKSGGGASGGGGGVLGLVGKVAGTIVGGLVGGPIGATVGGTLGGAIGSFDLGAWEISRDQAGFLHKGETVVPANAADSLRDLLSGGGGTTNGDVNLHYAPNINAPAAPDLEQLLHRQGQTMLGWINAQMRSGALRPPPG